MSFKTQEDNIWSCRVSTPQTTSRFNYQVEQQPRTQGLISAPRHASGGAPSEEPGYEVGGTAYSSKV